jgi:GNAT superfamily N-acetyltransferase
MLTYRRFQPDDFESCLDLIRRGHDPSFTAARFRWLHASSSLGPSEIALCLDESEVVGIYSVIRKTVRLRDQVYTAGRDVDPVVDPRYRGQGIFTRLLEFGLRTFRGIDFFVNFANEASAPGFRRCGWFGGTPIEDRIFQFGYQRVTSRDFLRWAATGARQRALPREEVCEIDADTCLSVLNGAGGHSAVRQPPDRLAVDRSAAYLKWRYLDSPLHRYRLFLHGTPSHPLALAVGRFDEAASRLLIVDVVGLRQSPCLSAWLPLWKTLFPRGGVGVWSTVPRSMRPGFAGNPLRRRQGIVFLMRAFPGKEALDAVIRENRWFMTHGDLEIL